MIYLDTSFLAPFYISEAIEAVLLDLPVHRLAISDWTRVEFASLLTRRVRMGELTQEVVEEVTKAFEADLAEAYMVFSVNREDFSLASEFLLRGNTGLRAGDALHLGIAYNRRTDNILSLDRGLIAVVKVLGINASSGGVIQEDK